MFVQDLPSARFLTFSFSSLGPLSIRNLSLKNSLMDQTTTMPFPEILDQNDPLPAFSCFLSDIWSHLCGKELNLQVQKAREIYFGLHPAVTGVFLAVIFQRVTVRGYQHLPMEVLSGQQFLCLHCCKGVGRLESGWISTLELEEAGSY